MGVIDAESDDIFWMTPPLHVHTPTSQTIVPQVQVPLQPVPQVPPPVPLQNVSLSRQLLFEQHPLGHVVGPQTWQAPPAQPNTQLVVVEP